MVFALPLKSVYDVVFVTAKNRLIDGHVSVKQIGLQWIDENLWFATYLSQETVVCYLKFSTDFRVRYRRTIAESY